MSLCAALMMTAGCGNNSSNAEAQDESSAAEIQVNDEEKMVGAYTEYRPLTDEEKTMFADVVGNEKNLTPSVVSTQVVAGINYSFICTDAENNEYKVTVYKPLPGQGDPKVTSLEPAAK